MDENTGNKILIREFDENKGVEVVMKLEKSCETGAQKGMSIISNISGDPLSRIRFYHVHVMLVSESNYETLSLFFWVINHKVVCLVSFWLLPSYLLLTKNPMTYLSLYFST